jgi:hypothetical protein
MATLESGYTYGAVLVANKKPGDAVPVLAEVRDGCRQRLGVEDIRTLKVQLLYSQALIATNQKEQAVPILTENWWVSRRIIGYGRPVTMVSLIELAHVLVSLHRDAEAAAFCAYVNEFRHIAQGATAPETLADLNAYAMVLYRLQRYKEAEPLFKTLVHDTNASKSPSPDAIADAQAKADECARLRNQSKTPAQSDISSYQSAMTNAEQAGREGHDFSQLEPAGAIADSCNHDQNWSDAANLYQKIIEARKRQQPPDVSAISDDETKLAKALLHLDRVKDAVSCLRDVLEISRDRFGPADAHTATAAAALADAMDADHNPASAAGIRTQYGIKPKPPQP